VRGRRGGPVLTYPLRHDECRGDPFRAGRAGAGPRKDLSPVAWFGKGARSRRPTIDREAHREDLAHLEQFAGSRRGVEAFLEPRTTMTQTTVVLVAHDGEWTRRRVGSPESARRWAHNLSIPFYDVQLVGYPQRMRDYNARQRRTAG
jgi:hypothetical protein